MEGASLGHKDVKETLETLKLAKNETLGELNADDSVGCNADTQSSDTDPRANYVTVIGSEVPNDNPWNVLKKEDVNSGTSDETLSMLGALETLTDTDRAVISTAACLGTLDTALLCAATGENKDTVSQALKNALTCGILTSTMDEYSFANDAVQRDLYVLLHPTHDDRTKQHVTIGRSLVETLSEDQVKEHYYTILRQFKLGEASISTRAERTVIASLCLEAGEYSVANSNFALASLFLEFGIVLLGDSSWKNNYDLTLALYNDAAEVEYSRSNFSRVDELVATVLLNAHSFRDSFRARASRIYSLSSRYQMKEAINESLQVLDHLGETLPANPTRRHIARELVKTWRLLKGKTNEMILRMPIITNPDKVAALQILNLLFPGAYRTQPQLWGIIILRIVRLTLLYGTNPVSAIGFASYSAISSMITGNVEESFKYGELALALVDKFGGKEWIPRVYLGVYGHASSYKYYLRDAYDKFRYAHQVGLETGDIEFSCLAAHIYCLFHIVSGDRLLPLEKEVEKFVETYKLHRQDTAIQMARPVIQFIHNMMGLTDDPKILVGDDIQDESVIQELLATAKESNDEISLAFLSYYQVVLAYVFNDYELAAERAKGLYRVRFPPYLHPSMSSLFAFYALSMLAVCNDRRGLGRQRILLMARRSIKKLKTFSMSTPANCLGKMYLLKAELAVVTGKVQEANCNYVSAISVATRYDDWMMHAIACERAGRFMESNAHQDEAASARYFREARDSYKEWGALAKVEQLEHEMPGLFADVCE